MSTYLWILPAVTIRTREDCLELEHDNVEVQFEGLQIVGLEFIRLLDGTNVDERIMRDAVAPIILPVLRDAGWLVTSSEPPAKLAVTT